MCCFNYRQFFFSIWILISSLKILQSQYDSFYNKQYEPRYICPPEKEIAPCKCNNSTFELECYGSEINDVTLADLFTRLVHYYASTQEKHVRGLKLYKTEITYLNKPLLGEIAMESVDLNGNQNMSLNSIHRVTLVTSKDILKSFRYSGIPEAFWVEADQNDGAIFEIVDGFMQLNTFWVSDSNIPKVQRSAFGRCELPNVKTVYLARNEIQEIGDYAFYRLPNLTYVNLRNNYISRISNLTFAFEKPNEEILTLDLTNNQITIDNIDKGAFTSLNRPVVLNLFYNLIDHLNEDIFKPILENSKSSINVKNNPIVCDCRMNWLISESHDYMDRVYGVTCKGRTELWYFTEMDLESKCNESVTVQSSALKIIQLNHFTTITAFLHLIFGLILNCGQIPFS